MCTILLAHRVRADAPLLLAANRDERLDRPAEGPALRTDRSPAVLAPRDLAGGGTWLGINARGLVVGITNRAGTPPDPGRRSRGELVFEALRADTPGAAAARIAGLTASDYNPFHLLFASVDDARLLWSDGEGFAEARLDPGLHVLTERSFGAAPTGREALLHGRLAGLDPATMTLASLTSLLAIEEPGNPDVTSVELAGQGYGTRSSTAVALGEAPRFLHADGAPSRVAYADQTDLLRALFEGRVDGREADGREAGGDVPA